MVMNLFGIGYHFEKFGSQVAIRKKKLISHPVNPSLCSIFIFKGSEIEEGVS